MRVIQHVRIVEPDVTCHGCPWEPKQPPELLDAEIAQHVKDTGHTVQAVGVAITTTGPEGD